jgi:hypothetical protein
MFILVRVTIASRCPTNCIWLLIGPCDLHLEGRNVNWMVYFSFGENSSPVGAKNEEEIRRGMFIPGKVKKKKYTLFSIVLEKIVCFVYIEVV